MKEYDYSKLKGKIREFFATQSDYAQRLSISNTSLSNKLNNKTPFDQNEIVDSIDIFNLNLQETFDCFFNLKVDKKSTK